MMFWRFGGYATISTIDAILDKPDVTLQELLEESDLIQELKQCNTKLIEYLRDENVLRRLLEYVIAVPSPKPELGEEEPTVLTSNVRTLSPFKRSREYKAISRRQEELEEWEQTDKARQKNAYVACEILSSETWSIVEALMENQQHLKVFWEFMRRVPPLDALDAGYFTKINETLLDKKPIEMLHFVRSLDGIVPAMVQHVDCPMVMDLLLKMISMERVDGAAGVVDVRPLNNRMAVCFGVLNAVYSGYKARISYHCSWPTWIINTRQPPKHLQVTSSKPSSPSPRMPPRMNSLASARIILPDSSCRTSASNFWCKTCFAAGTR